MRSKSSAVTTTSPWKILPLDSTRGSRSTHTSDGLPLHVVERSSGHHLHWDFSWTSIVQRPRVHDTIRSLENRRKRPRSQDEPCVAIDTDCALHYGICLVETLAGALICKDWIPNHCRAYAFDCEKSQYLWANHGYNGIEKYPHCTGMRTKPGRALPTMRTWIVMNLMTSSPCGGCSRTSTISGRTW